jgi:hypothetical protein
MLATIAKWYAWLKKATAKDDERLGHIYSDGEQLWATNGYVLHALDVATGRRGRVTLGGEGMLQIEEAGDILPFAETLPRGEPRTSIVVSAEFLRHAAEGQEAFVRLSIYSGQNALELASGGKYALVMGVTGVPAAHFWKPGQRA